MFFGASGFSEIPFASTVPLNAHIGISANPLPARGIFKINFLVII